MKKPIELIFFVTNKCNLNCDYCCYKDTIDKKLKNLSLYEIEKIAKNYRYLSTLLISGGEPFLRSDLPQICSIFLKYNKLNKIFIPTNGTITNKLIDLADKLIQSNPSSNRLIIAVSVNEYHGKYFYKKIKTIKKLLELKKRYKDKKFYVFVSTTMSRRNLSDLWDLKKFFQTELKVDRHLFGIVRPTKTNRDMLLHPKELKFIKNSIITENNCSISGRVTHKFYSSIFDEFIELIQGKKVKKCLAGIYNLVLENNGFVKICEPAFEYIDIRKFDYDINKVITSEQFKKNKAKLKDCKCWHPCFIIPNSIFSFKKMSNFFFKYILHFK